MNDTNWANYSKLESDILFERVRDFGLIYPDCDASYFSLYLFFSYFYEMYYEYINVIICIKKKWCM